jgi:hypothetical protein
MKYPQPNLSSIWADAGAISVPSTLKIAEGWVSEIPPCEQANFIENRQDKAIAYSLQMGIPEWNSATEYQLGSYISYNQVVYKSLGVNTNKQPNIFPLNWVVAFDNAGSADGVQQELDALILEDDPFDQYALKDAAVFTAKANGTSFSANTGLPTDNLSDAGHSFVGDGDSGMFKDGNDLVFTVDAVERGRIKSGALTASESSTAMATTEWVKQLIAEATQIKVGGLHLTTNTLTPDVELGYGTWQRYAEGRAIVGFSSDVTTATPVWAKTVNSTFGEYDQLLLTNQMPTHSHGQRVASDGTTNNPQSGVINPTTPVPNTSRGQTDTIPYQQYDQLQTDTTGGGQPHNNVQPSIVVAIWKRVT